MSFVDWTIIGLYLGCLIAVGRYFARRQKNTKDYFLGLVLLLASRLIADMTGIPDLAVIVVIGTEAASVLLSRRPGLRAR